MNLQKDVVLHTRGEEGLIVEGGPEKTGYQESTVRLQEVIPGEDYS